jgi:serine/threonine-protein kinase
MSTPRLCPSCRLQVDEDALRCPRDGSPLVLTLERTALPDPLTGVQVGEYRIEERIGSGGMGVVYRAVQPLIGKRVAVKILRPEIAADPDQMERLLAEARAVTAIHHRGIIDVFGFGQLPDGRQCITMELLEGVTLEHLVESGRRLPWADVVSVLDELLSALAAAHAAGVIHRDLKPSNVFLSSQSDGTSVVKVLDFGLAKRAAPGASSPQTRVSLMVGTPEFMAPEQARGEPVGPPTDLYALGVIAYQLFTGRLPFEGQTPIEIILQHLDKPPPPLEQLAPELPERLQALVLALLAKAPTSRPQRAEDVRHKLRQLDLPGVVLPPVALSGATALRPLVLAAAAASAETPKAVTSELAKTFLRRRPLDARTLVIGAALLLVTGTAAALVHARGTPPAQTLLPSAPRAPERPSPAPAAHSPAANSPGTVDICVSPSTRIPPMM